MTNVVQAPWNAAEIMSLEQRQQRGHPYTCKAHSDTALVPTRDGWVCPLGGCGYRQDWAHTEDVYAL